jgi:hypothetical protein
MASPMEQGCHRQFPLRPTTVPMGAGRTRANADSECGGGEHDRSDDRPCWADRWHRPVSDDVDSGGVYGTIPSSIANSSTLAQGDTVTLYDCSKELYSHVVGTDSDGTDEAPTAISGTGSSNIDSGYLPFHEEPIYLDYVTPTVTGAVDAQPWWCPSDCAFQMRFTMGGLRYRRYESRAQRLSLSPALHLEFSASKYAIMNNRRYAWEVSRRSACTDKGPFVGCSSAAWLASISADRDRMNRSHQYRDPRRLHRRCCCRRAASLRSNAIWPTWRVCFRFGQPHVGAWPC